MQIQDAQTLRHHSQTRVYGVTHTVSLLVRRGGDPLSSADDLHMPALPISCRRSGF